MKKNSSLSRKTFEWLVDKVLLNANWTIKSRALGLRENNPDKFWITKNVTDIFESLFGKDLFAPEYSPSKIILAEDIDYFGLISKAVFMDDLINVYLQQTYKKNKHLEINQAIEKYVKNNIGYCLRLFGTLYINKFRELSKDIIKILLDLSGISGIINRIYKKNRFIISDYYENRKFGLILGVNLSGQYNYLLPIFEAFGKKNISILYLRGSRSSDSLVVKKDWGYIWNLRFPWILKILGKLKNRTYDAYKNDKNKLIKRIMDSDVEFAYKQCIIKNLDRELHQYYTYKYFLEEILNELNPSFVFVMPERAPLQRTLLMLIRKKNIPTITYNPLFNMGNGIIQWSYLADWVLVSNKKFANLLQGKGFPENRINIVGSTLVDYPSDRDKRQREFKQGQYRSNASEVINILLLTKPAYKTISNDPVIETTIGIAEDLRLNYRIFIRPHPFDKDLYKRFTNKYSNKILLTERDMLLCDCIHDKDIIIICGISGALMECLPSLKTGIVVDISKNVDKSFMYKKDIKEIVPLFENLGDFKIYLERILSTITMKNNKPYEIPQSLIDDFYYKLDGKASDRICEFVLSKVN